MPERYRILTRGDFDGVVCAVLFKSLAMMDSLVLVHPKDMQDGKVPVTDRDITANLPYVPGVHLAFDHHSSEAERIGEKPANLILEPDKPSAARVIYDYYGGKKAFPKISDEMLASVDEADSAHYTEFGQIFEPKDWTLLNYVLDPRTGLSGLTFRISEEELARKLVDACLTKRIDQILTMPDVKERVDRFFDEEAKAREQIRRQAKVHDNLVVVDFRKEPTIHAVSRFVIYTMYQRQNISMTVTQQGDKTVFAVGKSIMKQNSKTNVGDLMLRYGGGGHAAAGTCRVPNDRAEETMQELIAQINKDG